RCHRLDPLRVLVGPAHVALEFLVAAVQSVGVHEISREKGASRARTIVRGNASALLTLSKCRARSGEAPAAAAFPLTGTGRGRVLFGAPSPELARLPDESAVRLAVATSGLACRSHSATSEAACRYEKPQTALTPGPRVRDQADTAQG